MKSMTPETRVQPEARVKAKIKNNIRIDDSENTKVEISTGALLTIAAAPALIGIWAAACFVGGMFASGSPFAFAKSWFDAIFGM